MQIDKRDELLVSLLGQLNTLRVYAVKSIEGIPVKKLTDPQHDLLNCLYATRLVDIVDGVVVNHDLTWEELLNDKTLQTQKPQGPAQEEAATDSTVVQTEE